MTSLAAQPVTPEELLAMPDSSHLELIDGCLVERNVSTGSSKTAITTAIRLGAFIQETDAGDLFDSEVGIKIFPNPRTMRRADVSFVRAERSPATESGFLTIAPDLIVEVVSPGDTAVEVRAKVNIWLEAGVPLVWVLWPETREANVWRANGRHQLLLPGEQITGDDILPGFSCTVSDLFPRVRTAPVG